jgi:hypothetical protein
MNFDYFQRSARVVDDQDAVSHANQNATMPPVVSEPSVLETAASEPSAVLCTQVAAPSTVAAIERAGGLGATCAWSQA